MSTPILLIQMPNVVMEHIFEYLEFPSILVLRKVCHDLRNFIDVIKPASRLRKIHVDVKSESLNFQMCFDHPIPTNTIDYYWKKGKQCLVKCNKDGNVQKTIVEDEDFVTAFFKDFDIVLRHQKTLLENFDIRFYFLHSTVNETVMESVKTLLRCMNHPFKVKSLFMGISNHNEILSILPYIDPKSLEHICIYESSRRHDVWLNLDEIGQLEQWKNAKELTIQWFLLPDLSQNFENFAIIDLDTQEVSNKEIIPLKAIQNFKHFSKITFCEFHTEEPILLKEIFLRSSTLNEMIIDNNYYCSAVIKQRLIKAFSQHFLDTNEGIKWFFRIPNTNQFLKITFLEKNDNFLAMGNPMYSIHLNRIERSDVPWNASILN